MDAIGLLFQGFLHTLISFCLRLFVFNVRLYYWCWLYFLNRQWFLNNRSRFFFFNRRNWLFFFDNRSRLFLFNNRGRFLFFNNRGWFFFFDRYFLNFFRFDLWFLGLNSIHYWGRIDWRNSLLFGALCLYLLLSRLFNRLFWYINFKLVFKAQFCFNFCFTIFLRFISYLLLTFVF